MFGYCVAVGVPAHAPAAACSGVANFINIAVHVEHVNRVPQQVLWKHQSEAERRRLQPGLRTVCNRHLPKHGHEGPGVPRVPVVRQPGIQDWVRVVAQLKVLREKVEELPERRGAVAEGWAAKKPLECV
jgi:hypothetical protein